MKQHCTPDSGPQAEAARGSRGLSTRSRLTYSCGRWRRCSRSPSSCSESRSRTESSGRRVHSGWESTWEQQRQTRTNQSFSRRICFVGVSSEVHRGDTVMKTHWLPEAVLLLRGPSFILKVYFQHERGLMKPALLSLCLFWLFPLPAPPPWLRLGTTHSYAIGEPLAATHSSLATSSHAVTPQPHLKCR